MEKRLMVYLLGFACVLGVVLVLIPVLQLDPRESADSPQVEIPDVTLDADAALTIYNQSCISCHGNDLEGSGIAPALDETGNGVSREYAYTIIMEGRGIMPGFEDQYTDEEIANLALWLEEQR